VPFKCSLRHYTEEKDACGVGFIASLKGERTHKTVKDSLMALGCMEHRGACSADDDSGDGAGIMCTIPWKMLGKYCDANGIEGFAEGSSGVGMVFLPQVGLYKLNSVPMD
jgi:glutamate synthase (ferredoxin)